MDRASQKPQWTQEEAIAFECAREVISDRIAIISGLIAAEEAKQPTDMGRIEELEAEMFAFHSERAELHLDETAKIARIRKDYGAFVRAWHRKSPLAAE